MEEEDLAILQAKMQAMGLDASNRYDQISRMAKVLPPTAVKPNDSWDFVMKVGGEDFSGTAALLGYTDYDGKDVAVLQMSASVSLDVADALDDMDDFSKGVMESAGIKIKDGVMNGLMYWDMEYNFARWICMTSMTTMEMEDPMDTSISIQIPTTDALFMYATVYE